MTERRSVHDASVVLGALLTIALSAACSSESGGGDGGGSSSPAASVGPTGGPVAFGAGPCGACVRGACASVLAACEADPGCAAYVSCLEACPVGDRGDADPRCGSTCPRGATLDARLLAADVDACRDPGPGSQCAACSVRPRELAPQIAILNQTCGPSAATSACVACQDLYCCETYEACIADRDCAAYRDCAKDEGAFADCAERYIEASNLFAPDIVCAKYHCAIDQPSCDRAQRDPCLECAYTRCTKEWAASEGTGDGFLLGDCIGSCEDPTCERACYDRYPAARDALFAYGACVTVACGGAC